LTYISFYVKVIKQKEKEQRRIIMATNVSNRTGNVKNLRSHSLRANKKRQKLNLQIVRTEDGRKVRMSTKEKRELLKNAKAA